MDAIEVARRAGGALHNAALARGADPWAPLKLALNEAQQRGIGAYPVPAGDPALKGGLAVFDHQGQFILYADAGSEFDRAFLVAHEIGHVELEGLSADNVTLTADPARPSDGAGSALDRVVDYSRRERREVRMDLFARELLIPRPWMRRLYLAGETRQAIAARLAPLDVITQQLLDALLLPIVEAEPPPSTALPREPDHSQLAAIGHRGPAMKLEAGPGTGKTETLINHVDGLLKDGVPPEAILVLTFSNKAAGELIDRLAARHPTVAAGIAVGTFHSFGLDLVRRFHDRLGLPPSPRLVDRADAIALLEDDLVRLPLHHYRNLFDPTLDLANILAAISRAKDEVADAARYKELAEAMRARAGDDPEAIVRAEKCLEVAAVYDLYQRRLLEIGAVDFGDLVALPARLVRGHGDVRAALADRHRHIIVDEYQDVNRASVALLRALAASGNRIWAVGDGRQSIYRFRGASAINMRRFEDDFPGAETRALGVNYRSRAPIVDAFTAFATTMKASAHALPLALEPRRGKGQPVEHRVAGTPEDEIAVVAASIEHARSNGSSYRDQAVLCAGNNRVADMAAGLEAWGIPVLFLGNLFERPEIKDMLALLSLLDDRFAAGLVRAATMPEFAMPIAEVQRVVSWLRDSDAKPMAWSRPDAIPGIAEETRAALGRLAATIAGFTVAAQPWDVFAALLLDAPPVARRLAEDASLAARMQGIALWQLLNFARALPPAQGAPVTRLLQRIRRIVLLSDDRELRQLPGAALAMDGVRLMTIHASKGLEFGIVHLPSLVVTSMPRNRAPQPCPPPDGLIEGADEVTGSEAIRRGHDEEEECLFFVALSRARDQLITYASSQQRGGKGRSPSPFLVPLDRHLVRIATPPRLEAPIVADEALILEWVAEPEFTDAQIAQHDGCPRRFLYTHLLRLGGRRAETAFMRMHAALETVLEWIRSEHAASEPEPQAMAAALEAAWTRNGPAEHPYAADYRTITENLVARLIAKRKGQRLLPPEPITLAVPGGAITIRPDHVIAGPDDTTTVRRVRTGKPRSKEFDGIEYTLLLMAARQAYGPEAIVEAVHLSVDTNERVEISANSFANRQSKVAAAVAGIRVGDFPAKPDPRRCPRCPHLFVCGALPAGTISAKI